jgi:hypothetical protein
VIPSVSFVVGSIGFGGVGGQLSPDGAVGDSSTLGGSVRGFLRDGPINETTPKITVLY